MVDLAHTVHVEKAPEREVFVGPRPFDRTEHELFFGRDREISELLSLVISSRVVLCYAPSGAGKTSLMNAGLEPRLEREGFEVFPSTRVRGLIPDGIDQQKVSNVFIFNALLSLAGEAGTPAELAECSLKDFLSARPHKTDEEGFPAPRILIFDQFEELITSYQEHWQEREGFFQQVHDALQADPLLRVIFIMREDFLARIEPYTRILKPFSQDRFRLDLLGREGALAAVTGPLRGTGRHFKEGVPDILIKELRKVRVETAQGESVEVEGEYVEPVQLQVVCRNLWTSLPPAVEEITQEHLKAYGDVDHALRDFYESCLEEARSGLAANELNMRQWFEQQLITPAGTRGIVFQGAKQTAGLPNPIVEFLENRHLIRGELRAGSRWYELTHDRFIEPIQRANEGWRARRQARRSKLVLAVGGALFLALVLFAGFLSARQSSVTQSSESIYTESASTIVAFQTTAEVQLQAAQTTAEVQVQAAQQDAQEDVTLAKSRQLAAEALVANDPRLALLLAIEANRTSDITEARRSLHKLLSNSSVADGKFLRSFNPEVFSLTLIQRLDNQNKWVQSVAFSPDGQRFVYGGQDGTLVLRDITKSTGTPLTGHKSNVFSVTFSPDGRFIASASLDSQVLLWDASNGKPYGVPLLKHVGLVTSVAFSPDGNRLASGGEDNTICIWDLAVAPPKLLQCVSQPAEVWGLAWSPDGKTLAAASAGTFVRLLDTKTLSLVRTLKGQTGNIRTVAWSPDGRILASGSEIDEEDKKSYGEVILWDAGSGKMIKRPLSDTSQPVRAVAYDHNGRLLAIGRDDGTILLWDTRSQQPVGKPFKAHNHRVMSIAFSPDGQYMVSGSIDKKVALWNLAASTQSIAINQKGDLLATSQGAVISVWNLLADQNNPLSLNGHTDDILALAFSPDGAMLASAGRDKSIRLWNVRTGLQIGAPLRADGVLTLDISPDGKTLASGFEDGTVLLWDLTSRQPGHGFVGGHGPVIKVIFADGGRSLEAASSDGTLFTWDLTSNNTKLNSLPEAQRGVASIALSTDGQSAAFFQTAETAIIKNDDQRAHGIELSMWNESFDPTVNPDDIDFVVVKATQADFVDPKFEEFLQPIQVIPIRGAMHYFQPGVPWQKQADFFLSTVNDKGFNFFVLDLEARPEDGSTTFLSDAEQWLKYVEGKVEQKVLLQTNPAYMTSFGSDGDWMKEWPLVLMNYPSDPDRNGSPALPQGVPDWKIWQYTGNGNGAEYGTGGKNAYLEVYNGTPPDMAKWLDIATFTIYDRLSKTSIQPSRAIQVTSLNGIAFSPDGSYVAAASGSVVSLLDAKTGEEISSLSYGGETSLSLRFTSDSSKLAIGMNDGTVLLWDLSILRPGTPVAATIGVACANAKYNFSELEWTQFFPNEPYRPTCPDLPRAPSAQCPFVYTDDPVTGKWKLQTTILYKVVDREAAQLRALSSFNGRLLIREEEPEISHINRLYVLAQMADRSYRILEPDVDALKQRDDENVILHQGEQLLVTFDEYPVDGTVSQWWVMAVGYYSPLGVP